MAKQNVLEASKQIPPNKEIISGTFSDVEKVKKRIRGLGPSGG